MTADQRTPNNDKTVHNMKMKVILVVLSLFCAKAEAVTCSSCSALKLNGNLMNDQKPTYDEDCFNGPFTSDYVDTCTGHYCQTMHGETEQSGSKIEIVNRGCQQGEAQVGCDKGTKVASGMEVTYTQCSCHSAACNTHNASHIARMVTCFQCSAIRKDGQFLDDGKATHDTDCFDGPFADQYVDTCWGDYCTSSHGRAKESGVEYEVVERGCGMGDFDNQCKDGDTMISGIGVHYKACFCHTHLCNIHDDASLIHSQSVVLVLTFILLIHW